MENIYLDHAATTPVREEVVQAMLPCYREKFGNASSVHSFGKAAHEVVEESRRSVARAIGASPEEIFFTSGGTESDNVAVKGAMRACRDQGAHLITSSIEHLAVLNTAKALADEGFEVTFPRLSR